MISRLPKWVWGGGAILAMIAGMINAVGFLSFQHQGVTHLTGTTTLMGIAMASGDMMRVLHFFGVITSFVMGAAFSGFLIRDTVLKLGRRYGIALMVESGLLCLAVPLLHRNQVLGAYLASTACGLQNAMASTYSGAVLRTSHVSGLFTDIGILLGQNMAGLSPDKKRLYLCILLTLAFFSGSMLAAWLFPWFGYNTLLFPAVLTGLSGAGYRIYLLRQPHY